MGVLSHTIFTKRQLILALRHVVSSEFFSFCWITSRNRFLSLGSFPGGIMSREWNIIPSVVWTTEKLSLFDKPHVITHDMCANAIHAFFTARERSKGCTNLYTHQNDQDHAQYEGRWHNHVHRSLRTSPLKYTQQLKVTAQGKSGYAEELRREGGREGGGCLDSFPFLPVPPCLTTSFFWFVALFTCSQNNWSHYKVTGLKLFQVILWILLKFNRVNTNKTNGTKKSSLYSSLMATHL